MKFEAEREKEPKSKGDIIKRVKTKT